MGNPSGQRTQEYHTLQKSTSETQPHRFSCKFEFNLPAFFNQAHMFVLFTVFGRV